MGRPTMRSKYIPTEMRTPSTPSAMPARATERIQPGCGPAAGGPKAGRTRTRTPTSSARSANSPLTRAVVCQASA
ncbi:hypothetical protein ASD51_12615 [Streptomyces sp. Root55]|nr:hypothetical protein ASD26_04425 [Streptomyces sp. Root1319]KQZ07074.1 hypothetical protein ASD51_12615 [Streptomyces sp. Root55]